MSPDLLVKVLDILLKIVNIILSLVTMLSSSKKRKLRKVKKNHRR